MKSSGLVLNWANTATLMPWRMSADRAAGELRVFGELADQVVLRPRNAPKLRELRRLLLP